MINNRLVLDTENANYSFGSLHEVMKKGLEVALSKNPSIKKVLMLGYGGGSAVKLLNEKGSKCEILAVEIDPSIIDISDIWFPAANVKFICDDALNFLKENKETFDLIISDVFIDLSMPNFATETAYLERMKNALNIEGVCVINAIFKDKLEGELFQNKLNSVFHNTAYYLIFGQNHLFVSW